MKHLIPLKDQVSKAEVERLSDNYKYLMSICNDEWINSY